MEFFSAWQKNPGQLKSHMWEMENVRVHVHVCVCVRVCVLPSGVFWKLNESREIGGKVFSKQSVKWYRWLAMSRPERGEKGEEGRGCVGNALYKQTSQGTVFERAPIHSHPSCWYKNDNKKKIGLNKLNRPSQSPTHHSRVSVSKLQQLW